MEISRGKQETRRENCSNANWSTINLTKSHPGLNPGLRSVYVFQFCPDLNKFFKRTSELLNFLQDIIYSSLQTV